MKKYPCRLSGPRCCQVAAAQAELQRAQGGLAASKAAEAEMLTQLERIRADSTQLEQGPGIFIVILTYC